MEASDGIALMRELAGSLVAECIDPDLLDLICRILVQAASG